jgi:hypothetical protein
MTAQDVSARSTTVQCLPFCLVPIVALVVELGLIHRGTGNRAGIARPDLRGRDRGGQILNVPLARKPPIGTRR